MWLIFSPEVQRPISPHRNLFPPLPDIMALFALSFSHWEHCKIADNPVVLSPPHPAMYSLSSQGAAAAAAAAAAATAEALPTEGELALKALLEPQGVQSDLLTEVLQWRLAKPDCDRGAVVDGLNSRLAARGEEGDRGGGETVSAKATAAAMPGARLLVLHFKNEDKG